MYSSVLIDGLFVAAVTLIWFMLAYQCLLFFFGHRYYRQMRLGRRASAPVPDADLPAVSILVPCHNEERVIAHTIRKLQALEYPEGKVEILIINDGSTDRTADVVREFTSDPRVRLINVPAERAARGKSGALNYALTQARHGVIAIYDADNMPDPGALRPLAAQLVLDPTLGAAIGMYRAWNRKRAWLTRFLNIEGIAFQWILQAGRWGLMRLTTLPGTNYVIRRSLVEQLGGWDESALTEDAEMSIRIYQAGYRIQFIPSSVTWEQEPEGLKVWFRQRRRWVRGSNYLFQKYAGSLLTTRPRRIGFELLYSLSLYYVFFLAVVVSDVLFVLSLMGLIRIGVPGPYGMVWIFAYATFIGQLVIAISCEPGEDTALNILLTALMYFTYCQLWIPVVAVAFWDDFIAHREKKWAKTARYEVSAAAAGETPQQPR
ncbi:MAG TPA: glycosyltransferase [Bryobacteraceae bacterium]|nr:glycosyltransferase [Bryobacteraceae bacterium]